MKLKRLWQLVGWRPVVQHDFTFSPIMKEIRIRFFKVAEKQRGSDKPGDFHICEACGYRCYGVHR